MNDNTVDNDDFEPGHDDARRDSRPGRSSSAGEGTADQIERLRQSMNRGTSGSSSSRSRPSIGRNNLSRTGPEPIADSEVDDGHDASTDGYGEPAQRDIGETVYRTTARRRVGTTRESPDVTRVPSSTRPGVKTPTSADLDDDDPYYDDDDDFTEYDAPRTAGWRRSTPQAGGARRQSSVRPVLPTAIAKADLVNDAAALSIIGVGMLGLSAMAIVVANQAESLAPTFATHVSASGVLQNFEHYNGLWRLPLLAAMLTLMNIVAAWFISPLDRFASRFLLAAAVVVQLVAWVALFRIL